MPEDYNALYSSPILISDKNGHIGGITYLFTKAYSSRERKSVFLRSVFTDDLYILLA